MQPTTIVVLQVAGEEVVAIYHNQLITPALIMPEVLFSKINLQLSYLKFSVLIQRLYI